MGNLAELVARIEDTARETPMSIDAAVYRQAGRDPFVPVLYAGSLAGRTAVLARDLGRDEVLLGEPLIGGAGQRVRRALYHAVCGEDPPRDDPRLHRAVERVLLTNTVPYKPVGNKAYPPGVRERFRPFIAELLTGHWKGDFVITMGTEAFLWFVPYAEPRAVEAFWKRPDRYESQIQCTLAAICDGRPVRREVTVAPLPHPSPLNRTYLEQFPGLLAKRLRQAPI